MTDTNSNFLYCIGRRAAKGPRTLVSDQAIDHEKYTTGHEKLLKCKKKISISTFNARTLNKPGKIEEIIANAETQKISIVCLQEHRYYHEEVTINYKSLPNGWKLVTSSAWKNLQNSTIGGIGMLINKEAYASLDNIESINQRIMVATFNGNPSINIICGYSPTNSSLLEESESYYNELKELINSIPKHNVKIIAADMNAQLGLDIVNWSYNKTTNRNGQLLQDLVSECEMVVLNTKFQKRRGTMDISIPKWRKGTIGLYTDKLKVEK